MRPGEIAAKFLAGEELVRADHRLTVAPLAPGQPRQRAFAVVDQYPRDALVGQDLPRRQIKMLGLKQPVVASSAAFVPAAMQLLSPPDLENVWGVIDTYLPATDKGKNYAERFKQRFSMDADPYGAAYYDGAMLMAQAINAVGADPQKLQGYLKDLKGYQGVSHVYSFDAKGNGVHDVAIVKFARVPAAASTRNSG